MFSDLLARNAVRSAKNHPAHDTRAWRRQRRMQRMASGRIGL
jgi:hypothetical protein